MATVYTKTDNYGLNLYGDNDPADLRDGYNNSMRTMTPRSKRISIASKPWNRVKHRTRK